VTSKQDSSGASTLVDGGVAGALIRAVDWSANPIGRVETWPNALKALVRVMLSTKQATCLFWGPELINLYNDGFVALLGEKHPRAMGQRARDCWSDAWPVVGGLLSDVVEKGAAVLFQEMLVPIVRGGRLEDAWWNYSYSPAFDDDGAIAGVLVVATEITAEVAGRRQLEAASRTKDEFLAILGHELRNPLAPMQTALRLIQQRGFQPHDLAVMERQVGTIVRLVDDLLDVSRIAGGKIELRKRPLELWRVVQHGLETASPLLEERRHRIDLKVPEHGLPIDGDADRLSQVVSNLLTNAAKYSEAGTAIHVTAVQVGSRVQLRIRDHGIGIPAEMQSRVFDMFVQQPQALDRAKGGLGLGLTIVRSLVALHGGTVAVSSDGPRKGSEFVIELPLAARAEPAESGPRGRSTSEAQSAPPSSRARILVVDDNQDAAVILAEYLAELGHVVETAEDGPSALDVARAFKPTICLVDIGLPVMDGYELARRLRDLEGVPRDVRLIALTGYGLDSDRRRSAEAGFDSHLVKPVDLDVLEKELSRQVEQRAPRVAVPAPR
jgi:signal transduction histidine kinase/CheY-like chemotaxis protein